jgi:Fe-S-cluster formation regulator IscX/YfhJ
MEHPSIQETVTEAEPQVPAAETVVDQRVLEGRKLLENTIQALQDKLVVSFREARTTQNLNNMKLFEVRLVENQKYILIPSNLRELAQGNYLFCLFAKALDVFGEDLIPLVGNAYRDTMQITKESELFLNGYGAPLAKGEMLEYEPLMKGHFRSGLYCMCKYLTNTYKKFDPRIVRFGDSHHPVQELFGEAWASTRLTEKGILDLVLNATKKVIDTPDWVCSYILPKEELVKRFGLKVNKHLSQVFSELEQGYIEQDHAEYIKLVTCFDVPKLGTFDDVKGFQSDLLRVVGLGKRYKTLCKDLTDSRMKILYSGSKQEKARKRKIPIKDLIVNVRGTVQFLNTFQPNQALSVPKFVSAKYPQNDEDVRQLGIQLSQWVATLSPKAPKDRLENCRNWILSESSS